MPTAIAGELHAAHSRNSVSSLSLTPINSRRVSMVSPFLPASRNSPSASTVGDPGRHKSSFLLGTWHSRNSSQRSSSSRFRRACSEADIGVTLSFAEHNQRPFPLRPACPGGPFLFYRGGPTTRHSAELKPCANCLWCAASGYWNVSSWLREIPGDGIIIPGWCPQAPHRHELPTCCTSSLPHAEHLAGIVVRGLMTGGTLGAFRGGMTW